MPSAPNNFPCCGTKNLPKQCSKRNCKMARGGSGGSGGVESRREDSGKHMPKHRLQLILCMSCPALQLLQFRATVPHSTYNLPPATLLNHRLPLLASLCLHIAGGSFSLLVNNKSLRRICVSNERRLRERERGEVWQWEEDGIVDSLSCVCVCVLWSIVSSWQRKLWLHTSRRSN